MASIEVNSIISNKNTIIVAKNVMTIALSLIFLSFKKLWFVSTIDKNKNQLLRSLDKNRLKIQKELASELTTKFVPKIQFELDNTFNHVDNINKIIDRINDWFN